MIAFILSVLSGLWALPFGGIALAILAVLAFFFRYHIIGFFILMAILWWLVPWVLTRLFGSPLENRTNKKREPIESEDVEESHPSDDLSDPDQSNDEPDLDN